METKDSRVCSVKTKVRGGTREPKRSQLKGGEVGKSEKKKKWKKKRKKRKKQKAKHGRVSWSRRGKEGQKKNRRPRARQVLVKLGRRLFLILLLGQSGLFVNAAAEGLQRRTEMMERMRLSTKVETAQRTRQD